MDVQLSYETPNYTVNINSVNEFSKNLNKLMGKKNLTELLNVNMPTPAEKDFESHGPLKFTKSQIIFLFITMFYACSYAFLGQKSVTRPQFIEHLDQIDLW